MNSYMEIGDYLESILNEMQIRCGIESVPAWNAAFKVVLQKLNAFECSIVAKTFCELPWNIGSPGILAILQDVNILSAKEFILSFDDAEKAKLILNDLTEFEFSLITNIFVATHYDKMHAEKLNILMGECLMSLFNYLLNHPNPNALNYLKTMKDSLTANLNRSLLHMHVQAILSLHQSNVNEAFKNFSGWINEGVDHITFTSEFLKIADDFEVFVVNSLLKASVSPYFKNWKFYLILLQTIAMKRSYESTQLLKTFLRTRLRKISQLASQDDMLHLLLTARTVTASTKDVNKNLDAYADWYRQNIADMKYTMTSEEFENVMKSLEECVEYENEEDYLEIHAKISISPPVHFGKLVWAYKAKCKSRLAYIKNKAKPKECIVIEDSN